MKSSRVNVTLPSAGTYDSNFQSSTPVFSRTFWVSDADLARAEAVRHGGHASARSCSHLS
jgi:hypothetical protein